MKQPLVISALTKKRAELVGKLQHFEKVVRDLRNDIVAIDQSIIIFDDKYPIESIKPKKYNKHSFFSNGEIPKLIFEVLKEHEELANQQIYEILAEKKGVDLKRGPKRAFMKTVCTSLINLEKQDLLQKRYGQRKLIYWKIRELNLNT